MVVMRCCGTTAAQQVFAFCGASLLPGGTACGVGVEHSLAMILQSVQIPAVEPCHGLDFGSQQLYRRACWHSALLANLLNHPTLLASGPSRLCPEAWGRLLPSSTRQSANMFAILTLAGPSRLRPEARGPFDGRRHRCAAHHHPALGQRGRLQPGPWRVLVPDSTRFHVSIACLAWSADCRPFSGGWGSVAACSHICTLRAPLTQCTNWRDNLDGLVG